MATFTDNGGGAPNGSDLEFTYTFPVIQTEDVKVSLNGVTQATTKYTVDNVSNPTHIDFNNTSIDSSVQESSGAPKTGVRVRVYRETTVGKTDGNEDPKAVFAAGSSIRAIDLNANQEQALMAIHELQTRPVETENLQADAITNAKIADNSVDSEHYVDGSIDLVHMSANSVDSDQYVDGSIDLVHMSANSVDSDQYVDGSIDLIHMSPNSVDSDQYVDGSIDLAHMSANSVDSDQYVDGSIDLVHMSANSVDSDQYVDGSIDRVHLEADIIDSTKIEDDAVRAEHIQANSVSDSEIVSGTLDNRYYTETELDGGQLDNRYFTETELTNGAVDGRYYTEAELNGGQLNNLYFTESEITGGAVDGRYYTETELDAGQLDNRYYTETELNAGQLDNRYYTETEAEALFLRQDSSETIASGVTWSNADDKVATTAAINARIIDLVDDIGGFTVIANETSFPNTNPQGGTGQAAIMSIGALSQGYTRSGTTVTIANGTVGNSTVTITGVSLDLPSGFGLLVESTSTLNTYTFHRLVPKATEVTTVATNITNIVAAGANVADINNFADLYQISNSAPTQRVDGNSLVSGDLWFDNSNGNLRVWNGSSWAIITPAQSVLDDVAIVSGAITYSEDLGLITDAASTGSSNGSLDIVADALEDEITFAITVSSGAYFVDGVSKPALTLYKGWTYTFDVSDSSNANHPLRFSSGGSAYNTGVTVTGTQGQAGAKVQLVVPESQPTSFIYYCTNHSGMGNTITVKDDPIKTVSDSITNINAVAGNSTNINAVAANATNINTVAGSESNINRYADEYSIQSSNPSSPSAGDLWFSTTANILNFYNGSSWVGISPGIAGLINDANPALANHLDCNDKNLTEVGTVSGNNLQIDFGTL